MTDGKAAPAWSRGYDLDLLRQLAAPFAQWLKPHVHGAFGLPKENAIADALAADEIIYTRAGGNAIAGAALIRRLRSGSTQNDFADRPMRPRAGDIVVRSIAGTDAARERMIAALEAKAAPAIWVEDFVEAPHSAMWDARGYSLAGVKVMASSDLKGLWLKTDQPGDRLPPPLGAADKPALAVLDAQFLSAADQAAIEGEIAAYLATDAGSWADHYSTYNKRKSWAAIALAGFDPADPAFIEKPAEMSRAWKAENPTRLKAACAPTSAAPHFPATMAIVGRIPGLKQRIRLMRLSNGGGELTRHADITDPDAGTATGRVARLHIPIATNPACRFRGWGLDGQMIERHFPARALCYLDTRKPHAAINDGSIDRVHLVIDTFASGALRAMIAEA